MSRACFNVDGQNVPTKNLNDRSKEVLRLSNLTQTCIAKHRNDTHPSYGDPLVCAECKDFYQDLNNYYESLKNTGFCMDIVDLMNTTRTQWSSKLGCCLDRKQPEWLFIVLSLVMTSMPCVFYLAAFLFVSRTEHTVFRQRRLHETFSSSATISAMGSHD